MKLDGARHQKPGKPNGGPGHGGGGDGEAVVDRLCDEATLARHEQTDSGASDLLGQALARENMRAAWKRVRANKGSAGVDGLTVQETEGHLKHAWPAIRQQVIDGSYRPAPVRRVVIPKPGGGERELGIPTVTDRLIQQALLQVLQPLIDPTFSEHSHGFRPGRSAHDAVMEARRYVREGYRTVVDVDLEKFFDRVNHDILMDRLAKRVADKSVLRLIRRYLQAGIMAHGVSIERSEGTPQGGPLSPLLANVMLDEVDRELERRGHRFARYADDCNVYVKSQRAGERVLLALRDCYARLGLRINEAKTAVSGALGRKFLGFGFYNAKGGVQLQVAKPAMQKLRDRLRALTGRARGRSLAQIAQDLRDFVPGWKAYFRLAHTPKVMRELDGWLRRRLRAVQLAQWRRGRTIFDALRRLGTPPDLATRIASGAGRWWHFSSGEINRVLDLSYFDRLGVPRFS